MATLSGINATVRIEDVIVANLAKWEFTDTIDPLIAGVFGETFEQVLGMGLRKVSGTIEGFLDIADTAGQEALKGHYEARTKVTNFRLFIDDETLSTYYHCDTTEVPTSGVFITSMDIGAEQNAIIPVSMSFTASGDWRRFTEV